MGSRHPPRPYDEATLAALEQAFTDAWAVLEARDPLRDWVKDGQLSSNLSELMALADKGITKPDELCKRDGTGACVGGSRELSWTHDARGPAPSNCSAGG